MWDGVGWWGRERGAQPLGLPCAAQSLWERVCARHSPRLPTPPPPPPGRGGRGGGRSYLRSRCFRSFRLSQQPDLPRPPPPRPGPSSLWQEVGWPWDFRRLPPAIRSPVWGDGCGLSSGEDRREPAAAPGRSQVSRRLILTLPGGCSPGSGAPSKGHREGAPPGRHPPTPIESCGGGCEEGMLGGLGFGS